MSVIQTTAHLDAPGLEAALARMSALGQRPRSIWDAVGNYGANSTKSRFKHQKGPDDKRWKPSIRAQATGGQTLVAKSHLLRSITHNADNSGTAWGTNVVYAATHQEGRVISAKSAKALRFRLPGGAFVSVKKVTIPARPFVGVNDQDGQEIEHIALAAVDLAARPGGHV